MYKIKFFILALSLYLLTACGGGTSTKITNTKQITPEAYIFSSGDTDNDNAILGVFSDNDINATIGVTPSNWTGTEDDIENYQIVFLSGHLWGGSFPDMPEQGQKALLNFVSNGGGLITNAWLGYRANGGDYSFLEPALPFEYSGYTSGSSTTFIQKTSEPTINMELPESFTFILGNIAGTSEILINKTGASEFYTSTNPGGAGLIGWDYNEGRVASFSNLLTEVDLSDSNVAILLGNIAKWLTQ